MKAVIFDYGGVVRREDAAEFDDFAGRHGVPPGALWAAFHDIPEYAPSRRGEIGRDAYRSGVARALTRWMALADAERALAEWDEIQAFHAPVEPEIADLLPRLRGRVLLGLLSNAGAGFHARLAADGVAALFDDVVCSGDVGLAKPDPAVYRFAASRLGVAPPACLFIDDMQRNVLGAREAGMRAHHHHRTRWPELLRFLEDNGVTVPPSS